MFDLRKPWPLGLNRQTWLWFLLGLLAILAVLGTIDTMASRGAIGWPDQWRAPFFFVTDYGLSDWVLIPSLVLALVFALLRLPLQGLWRQACGELGLLSFYIFVGVGAPGLLTNLLKRLVGRGRPTEFDASGAFAFQNVFNDWTFQSFPSGHSATAMALAFTVGFLRPAWFPPLCVIGVVVAVSRVPVGMHYPTDVFAGIVVGMLGAYLVRNLFARRGWLFTQRQDGLVVPQPLAAVRQLYRRARA